MQQVGDVFGGRGAGIQRLPLMEVEEKRAGSWVGVGGVDGPFIRG